MTSRYTVGSVIGADDLDALPTGTKLEFTAGGLRISEVPPQESERDKLALELWNVGYPDNQRSSLDDIHVTTRGRYQQLADYVTSNFTRNGAQSPGDLDVVTDGAGDDWYRMENGNYTLSVERTHPEGGRTLDFIAQTWGLQNGEHLRDTSSTEALIDRDGDRWEQQSNGMYRMRNHRTGNLCINERTYDYLDARYSPLRAA